MPIGYQAHNLEHHRCADQCGVAGLIVRWGNLYDIASDEIQPTQPTQEALRFQGRDTADFRRPGSRCVDGIETVHIEGYVGRAVAHDPASFFDDSLNPERREFLHEHHAHTMRSRELDAVHVVLAAANADLNRALRIQQSVLDGQPKRGSMSEFGSEELAPCVGVGIDVNHSNGCVGGNRFEYWVCDRVVAARADRPHAGSVNFAIEGFDLLDLFFEVVPMRQAHVAEICDPAELVRIHSQCEIETPHEA